MFCCPEERPGLIPQPHHVPGYGGHIPSYRHRNGGTFGRLSRDAMEDPCVAHAPCPVLAPPSNGCCPPDPCCCRNPIGCADIGCCDPVCCPPPRIIPKRRKPPCEEMNCDPCKLMKCFPPMHPECGNSCQPSCPPSVAACLTEARPCCEERSYSTPCPPPCPPPCGGGAYRPSCGGGPPIGYSTSCGQPDPDAPCPPKKKNPAAMDFRTKYYPCGPPPPPCCDGDPRAHHLNRGPYVCPGKGAEGDNMVYRCCESMSPSYSGHIPGFEFHSTGRTTGKATWGTKQYMNKCLYFNTFQKP